MTGDQPEVLHSGKFLNLFRQGKWEYVERVGRVPGVIVAALTPTGHLLLVEQHRPPVGARVIELPAGLAGDTKEFSGESALTAASRELVEETGWEPGEIEEVARGPISAGLTNEVIIVTRARRLRRVGAGGGEPGENITVHEVPLNELDDWLDQRRGEGIHVDPKVYLAPGLLVPWAIKGIAAP